MATPGPNLPDLRVGARGPAVLAVQRHLTQKELYTGPIDGRFGQQTDAAVRSFQSSQGLPGDGIVGPATWAALGYRPGSGVPVRSRLSFHNCCCTPGS